MDLKAMLNDQADKIDRNLPAHPPPSLLYTSHSSSSQSALSLSSSHAERPPPHPDDRVPLPQPTSSASSYAPEPGAGGGGGNRQSSNSYFPSASPASTPGAGAGAVAAHTPYASRYVSSSPSAVAPAHSSTPAAVAFTPQSSPIGQAPVQAQSHLLLSQVQPPTREGAPVAAANGAGAGAGAPLTQRQHSLPLTQQHQQQHQHDDHHHHSLHHIHHYHQPHQQHPHHQQQQQQQPSAQQLQHQHQHAQPQAQLQPQPQPQHYVQQMPDHPHHASPASSSAYHAGTSTPLGPPAAQHHRPSPQAQRPPSSGYELTRRTSSGSIGSIQSRDYGAPAMGQTPALTREPSVPQAPPGDDAGPPLPLPPPREAADGDVHRLRERAASIESVSPKTIPRPPPVRHTASALSQASSPAGSAAARSSAPPPPLPYQATPGQPATPYDVRRESLQTPRSSHSSLPPQASPLVKKEAIEAPMGLKRNASVVSSTPPSAMPAKKRVKREGVPIWARSVRSAGCRPIRFDPRPADAARQTSRPERPVKQREAGIKVESFDQQAAAAAVNGQAQSLAAHGAAATTAPKWEESIINKIPHEDLIKHVCDWIYLQIGHRQPPPGAVFEIEAKIGNIIDTRDQARIRLPIQTESVFVREAYWNPTKFESTMDIHQHRHLNSFLNDLTQASFREAHTTNPSRDCIRAAHTVEVDDFLELSAQGARELGPAFHDYAPPNGRPWKVRRTVNKRTGEQVACIIKTRIADMEVFCPNCAFDYRISVNVEANWQGNPAHLSPVTLGGGGGGAVEDRAKDRVSYRHLAYQIDLTQISHSHSERKEHELEVEISVDEMRREIDKLLRAQRGEIEGDGGERYERLVRGFINNVRVLCREGSRV